MGPGQRPPAPDRQGEPHHRLQPGLGGRGAHPEHRLLPRRGGNPALPGTVPVAHHALDGTGAAPARPAPGPPTESNVLAVAEEALPVDKMPDGSRRLRLLISQDVDHLWLVLKALP